MLMKVYSVFDCKVEAYAEPFLMMTKGEAIREFTRAVHDIKCKWNHYPDDYSLFELGSFDTNSAKYTLYATPFSVIRANEVLGVPQPNVVNT